MQGSDCIRLRVNSGEICATLLSFAFRESAHHGWMLAQCGNKATMASLNQDVIARIPIVVPSRPVLREFQDFATDVLKQIAIITKQNAKLTRARDLLLPRLMSGELAA
jgi:type I restriction enzyme S subunit